MGKGNVSCQGGEEIKNVRISFFVSYDKGTSLAEWNIDHEKFGSAGGIITSIQASSESFSLKDSKPLIKYVIMKLHLTLNYQDIVDQEQ